MIDRTEVKRLEHRIAATVAAHRGWAAHHSAPGAAAHDPAGVGVSPAHGEGVRRPALRRRTWRPGLWQGQPEQGQQPERRTDEGQGSLT
jgi:hypothetical protein